MNHIRRVWINQPSTHSYLHKYHGTKGLACYEGVNQGGRNFVTFYFLEGDTFSMYVPVSALSHGWPKARES